MLCTFVQKTHLCSRLQHFPLSVKNLHGCSSLKAYKFFVRDYFWFSETETFFSITQQWTVVTPMIKGISVDLVPLNHINSLAMKVSRDTCSSKIINLSKTNVLGTTSTVISYNNTVFAIILWRCDHL